MSAITITELQINCALDRKAMQSIAGTGAGWVFGWIRPYVSASATPNMGSVVNLYQFNNFGGQMNNQIQVFDINNSGNNAIFNVTPEQLGINVAQ